MIYQLTDGATIEEIKAAGLDTSYAGRGLGVFSQDPDGVPWTAAYIALKADPVADLTAICLLSKRHVQVMNIYLI